MNLPIRAEDIPLGIRVSVSLFRDPVVPWVLSPASAITMHEMYKARTEVMRAVNRFEYMKDIFR